MKKFHLAALLGVCALGTLVYGADIPVVQDVDVVVAGGSSGAVAAAIAAKEAGARVFLAAPRPYLGEDLAGTLRLAREKDDDESSALYRAIFDGRQIGRASWPFTYTYDAEPQKTHTDPKLSRLSDGKYGQSAQDSVQFGGDVTVSVDLGAVRAVAGVQLAFYVREKPRATSLDRGLASVGFLTTAMEVSASRDGKTWTQPTVETTVARTGTDQGALEVLFSGGYRYVKVKAVRAADYTRQLLGELRIYKDASELPPLVPRTTPFAVKRALDEALLKAGVPYITGSIPCGVLKDGAGKACGIVIANRSGRQAIRAKVVIDATERGRVARLAGGETRPFMAGRHTFQRIVLSGEAPKGANVRVTRLDGTVPVTVRNIRPKKDFPEVFDAHFWLCAVDVAMKDGSARSFAEAEQIVRDLTFTTLQADAANTAFLAAPDAFHAKRPWTGVWKGAAAFDLDALRPKDCDNVYVLGPLADVPREMVGTLLHAGNFITIGGRVGRAAAETARGAAMVTGALSVCDALPGERTLTPGKGVRVGEHAKELPGYLVKASGRAADAAALPVLAECDTFVAGAGTGGGPAGIAAARNGAKTIVCEYLYVMGGVSTDGLIGFYYFGNRVGFTSEIDAGVKDTGAVFPQCKSEWYRREQRKAGAEIWYGSLMTGVLTEGNRLTGVVVVLPDGTRGVVRCKNAIDATGNAEIPALAGTDTEFLTDEELSVQGAGMARDTLGAGYANSDIGFVDDTDAADVFYFALRSRMSLPADTWDQAQVVNSRERRRMVGAFYMTPPDVVNNRTYPDTVVKTYSNFDSHGQTVHDTFFIEDPGHKPMYVNLPYRCLLPKTLDGVLVTGLGISAHRDAMPILRMQPDVQNQGYAAGWAAATAAKTGVAPRDIDVKELQRHLVEKKVIDEETANQKDSFPLSDDAFAQAVRDVADNYKGLGVLMTDRGRAIPLLQGAYVSAEGESKFAYGHVLAMMGRPDGVKPLLAKFKAMDWDKGWNYRGMGQFNRSVSWVDSYAIALGRCKAKEAVPALIEKADQLTEKSEYSHFRAIAKACEEIGDKAAIPALARVLQRPGIGGHAQKMQADVPVIPGYANTAGDWERTLSLREICIARALYRLGDTPDGLGRRTLEAYAADPRRAFAQHAKLVLGR